MRAFSLLGAALACAVSSAKAAVPSAADGRRLTIVAINDTHGALLEVAAPKWIAPSTDSEIGGADWFGGYLEAIREEAKEHGGAVIVLDAGDAFQGTLISNHFQGRSVTEVYNALGVTAAALGNHEFDFGIPVLQERIAQARYPILAANVFLEGTRQRPDWIRPSAMVDAGGIRVGVIGLATRETPLTTNPALIRGLEFVDAGPVAAQEADLLRSRGATVVVICAHAGPNPPENEIQRVAKAVQGKVDAIASGHHHVSIGPPPLVVGNVPIVQSGAKLQAFSIIELQLDARGRVTTFAVNDGSLPVSGGPQAILHTYRGRPAEWRGRRIEPDARVAAILRTYDREVRALREARIGETLVELRKGSGSDLLGNLAADALRSGAGGGLQTRFALQNAGGLRINEIPAGPITFGQIFDLYPFDNEQVVVSLRAIELRNALEAVLHHGKGPMRVSGLRYAIDWDKFGAGSDPEAAPDGAIVVRMIDDGGQVLCETKSCTRRACVSTCAPGTYPVSVTDFLVSGGDGVTMLQRAPRRSRNVLARDMLVAYVKEHRPLTEELLGGAEQPRWTQTGSVRRAQKGE